jgi:hypothetical protein
MIFAQGGFFQQQPELRTEGRCGSMSGLVRKADVVDGARHVSFVPTTEVTNSALRKYLSPVIRIDDSTKKAPDDAGA